jgi:hypothetical protein
MLEKDGLVCDVEDEEEARRLQQPKFRPKSKAKSRRTQKSYNSNKDSSDDDEDYSGDEGAAESRSTKYRSSKKQVAKSDRAQTPSRTQAQTPSKSQEQTPKPQAQTPKPQAQTPNRQSAQTPKDSSDKPSSNGHPGLTSLNLQRLPSGAGAGAGNGSSALTPGNSTAQGQPQKRSSSSSIARNKPQDSQQEDASAADSNSVDENSVRSTSVKSSEGPNSPKPLNPVPGAAAEDISVAPTERSGTSNLSRKELTKGQRASKISGKLDRTFSMIAPEMEGIKLSQQLQASMSANGSIDGGSFAENTLAGGLGTARSAAMIGPIAELDESPIATGRSRNASPSPPIPTPRPLGLPHIPPIDTSVSPVISSAAVMAALSADEPKAEQAGGHPALLTAFTPHAGDDAANLATTAGSATTVGLNSSPTPKARGHMRIPHQEVIERGQLAIVNPRSNALDKYYVRCTSCIFLTCLDVLTQLFVT